jgi:hypothetical protein
MGNVLALQRVSIDGLVGVQSEEMKLFFDSTMSISCGAGGGDSCAGTCDSCGPDTCVCFPTEKSQCGPVPITN